MTMEDDGADSIWPGRIFLAGAILLALMMFIHVADCPVCVDGVGPRISGGMVAVHPCHVCGSYRKKVPIFARWVHLIRSR